MCLHPLPARVRNPPLRRGNHREQLVWSDWKQGSCMKKRKRGVGGGWTGLVFLYESSRAETLNSHEDDSWCKRSRLSFKRQNREHLLYISLWTWKVLQTRLHERWTKTLRVYSVCVLCLCSMCVLCVYSVFPLCVCSLCVCTGWDSNCHSFVTMVTIAFWYISCFIQLCNLRNYSGVDFNEQLQGRRTSFCKDQIISVLQTARKNNFTWQDF